MAEKEYIDKVAFNYAIREAVKKYPNSFYNGLEVARQIAHDLPAADVRPVVMCCDCKYWKQWDSTTHYLCTYVAGAKFIRNADDFCSRGEREES